MLLAFIIYSLIVGVFGTFIWSSAGAANLLIKMVLAAYTVFALVVLCTFLAPLINTGVIRLI